MKRVDSYGGALSNAAGGSYTATVSGLSGVGTLGLNLADDSTIRNLAGNPLTQTNVPASFSPRAIRSRSPSLS